LAIYSSWPNFLRTSFDGTSSFPTLWKLAHPPVLLCMRKDSFELLTPRLKTAWQKAAGKEPEPRFCAEAEEHFDRADACYRTLLGRVARNLAHRIHDGGGFGVAEVA
jgi:CRISPR-associated exonuclease Cas4